MKKRMVTGILIGLLVLITGCQQVDKSTNAGDTNTPTQVETTNTPTPTPTTDEDTAQGDNTEAVISDYYPFLKDTESYYEGEGNEYASFHMYADFIDESTGKIQVRIDDGGSVTVQVIQNKDGKLSILRSQAETYYRENLLTKSNADGKEEILLMEPLVTGTSWELPDGNKRTITGIDVDITTPYGDFKALEVTKEDTTGQTKEYYVKGMGLVARIVSLGDTTITSLLKTREENVPYTQTVNIYHWNLDESMQKDEIKLDFYTNDLTKVKIEDYLKSNAIGNQSLISTNTKINYMYLGEDNIAYIDFTKELVNEMNAGAGYENQILQCIVNTVGDYYGVNEVYLTIDGNPYASGHQELKKGETFKVNYSGK